MIKVKLISNALMKIIKGFLVKYEVISAAVIKKASWRVVILISLKYNCININIKNIYKIL